MRIKKLELCGFKSFVDPTALEFSQGISGIVGPNGCGKSNIVDALRWVLGEQSAKRLRGDAMEDVIFNGTDHGRGPAGMAEVSLLLENDGRDCEQEISETIQALRDVPEILVTRRYFRSGESEYLINRRPCRLKDITELFLGTGVGTKAYAMIEQGRVDQLVNARPEDLRLFIEEAAGTTLYRDRRLAAERKMERTRENLARVNDILQEIERQIAFFRRMAKRAEQYRVYQAELRTVELQLARRVFDRLSAEIAELDGLRRRLREQEQEAVASIGRLESERDAAREILTSVETELRGRQESLFRLRTVREREQTRLEMLGREDAESVERLARIERDQAQMAIRLDEARGDIARREASLRELGRERGERTGSLTASLTDVAFEEREVGRISDLLEKAKTEVVEQLRKESEFRNQRFVLEQREEERRARRQAFIEDLRVLDHEASALGAEAGRITAARGSLDERTAATREELEITQRSVERFRVRKVELERATLETAGALAESESRLGAAEEVERGYERYQEGVRAVMRKHAEGPNGILNLVAEILEAPPEFEKAVAAVLGDRLQYVIVRTPEDARDAICDLKTAAAGRSSFVSVEPYSGSTATPGADELKGRSRRGEGPTALIDVVHVEEGYGALAERLLGDAILVENLESGISLWRQNGRLRTMVTPEGDVVYPNGVISGGSVAPHEEHLLAQRREIRRLRIEVERLRSDLTDLDTRRGEASARLDEAEKRLAGVEESLRSLSVERVSLEKDAEKVAEGLARGQAQTSRSHTEIAILERELAEFAAELLNVAKALEETALERSSQEESRRRLEAELAERRRTLEARARAATELRVLAAQAAEKEERLREGLEQLSANVRDLEERLTGLEGEGDALRLRAASRESEGRALRGVVDRSLEEESSEDEKIEAIQSKAALLRQTVERVETELTVLRGTLEAVRSQRAELDVTVAEKSLRRDHAVEGIRERYQLEIAEVAVESADETDLEARLLELRQKVDRIDRSQVAVEAIGELEEEERRRELLMTQKADLERSLGDLQKTIASLNRASRDRFAETFAAVNEKFQETFPKLFRGGQARLVFTDETNLLETGVDIHVQPPGMNLRTLSLLSGGQKALTAVSLIFSLFMCRPSPFCVLDEVDAPLDDANIDRFNEMVREMGNGSQFLIITHNKRTMEVAEGLYGVTMEEPGVSKIVSVRFEHAA